MNKPTIFITCTGLGRINRGYESFTRELHDVLQPVTEFNFFLFKGGGPDRPERQEFRLPNAHRKSWLAGRMGTGEEPYYFEQKTFAVSLLMQVLRHRPQAILISDYQLGYFLMRGRRLLPRRYWFQLIFSNGAPADPPYEFFDFVQQLLPHYIEQSNQMGYSTDNQVLIPYGFSLPEVFVPVDKAAFRRRLKLPTSGTLLLSVGAVTHSHKRMDYLIKSVHACHHDDVSLLILGETDEESPPILAMGRDLLGDRFMHRRVPANEVADYYRAADLFILASLIEGLPRVSVEALSADTTPTFRPKPA